MRCKKAKRMEAEKMALNLSNIPIVIFIKIQGLEVQVRTRPCSLSSNFVRQINRHSLPRAQPKPKWMVILPRRGRLCQCQLQIIYGFQVSSSPFASHLYNNPTTGTHAAWPAAVLNSQVYQLHNQNFHLAGAAAAGHKDLKELAIFTGQQNESQVSKQRVHVSLRLTQSSDSVGVYTSFGRTIEYQWRTALEHSGCRPTPRRRHRKRLHQYWRWRWQSPTRWAQSVSNWLANVSI